MITLDEMLALKARLWCKETFTDYQVEIVDSWCRVRETVVGAGTELGKDYIAGFLVPATFLICQAKGLTCKLLTLSVAEDHLKVLWGEVGRFLRTSALPLLAQQGGPLVVNYQEIRRAEEAEVKNPFNYAMGMVYQDPEKLQGHYADFNGVIGDESSALEDAAHTAVQPMKRFLWIGNTNACANFYRRAVKGGGLRDDDGRELRRVIKIRAVDSPNVKRALRQVELGLKPDHKVITPGVITWDRYQTYRRIWPPSTQRIKLDAEFPDDQLTLLFPPEWLEHSKELARRYEASKMKRQGRALGVDPAEGGDRTAFCVVDEWGVLDLVSKKTPDTTVIIRDLEDLVRRWQVPWDRVVFDRACGKAHADRLRMQGRPVQTVHFGESILLDLKRGLTLVEERREQREQKSVYKNRRVEMYHTLSGRVNPSSEKGGFAIPARFEALHRQLEPVPFMYDKESGDGKLILPGKQEMIKTLYNNEGSPDEADALALAVYGLTHKSRQALAGVV